MSRTFRSAVYTRSSLSSRNRVPQSLVGQWRERAGEARNVDGESSQRLAARLVRVRAGKARGRESVCASVGRCGGARAPRGLRGRVKEKGGGAREARLEATGGARPRG